MKPLSRARAREVDTIVAGIVDLMTRGKWVTGRSHQELAQTHGVSVSRVEDWATEAARCLRVMGLVDKEAVIAQHRAHIAERASRFVRIADAAEEVTEFGPAIAALSGWGAENDREARLLGLNAPSKHEVASIVCVLESAPWKSLEDRIFQALEPHPKAREAVVAALAQLEATSVTEKP